MDIEMTGIEGLFSRREVAELLKLSVGTLRRYERQGLLKSIRVNSRATRYRKTELAAFLARLDRAENGGVK